MWNILKKLSARFSWRGIDLNAPRITGI